MTCFWLFVGYVFAFLRAVHRVHMPVWQAACFACVIVLVIGYCLEACGVPLSRGQRPARGWNMAHWPAPNRRNIEKLALVAAGVTGLLSLAGFLTGK